MSIRTCTVLSISVITVILSAFLMGRGDTARVDDVEGCPAVAEVPNDWFVKVMAQIEREEYHASVNEHGLQAPNRSQNVRTYFHDGGIEVVPRTRPKGDTWSFSWCTLGWGREGRLRQVAGASCELRVRGSRVSYVRDGLEEWYENGKEGLEQGFLVRERPEAGGLLCIEGRIGSGLRPEFSPDEGAIDFMDEEGTRVIRYAELFVRDALGREVPSQLRLDGEKVAILFDDVDAAYPIVVDPLVTSPSWTAESNDGRVWFGCSVGTAGDVNGDGYSDVIIGAEGYDNGQNDEGRAFVYHGSAGGLSPTPAWTAESDVAKTYFAHFVGTAGDVNGDGYSDVVVGADGYTNDQVEEGRAYVYHGSPSGLALTPAWTAEGNQETAWFGCSGGTAGDVNGDGYSDVIIGAEGYDTGQTNEGRAYVYHGSPGGLTAVAFWVGEGDTAEAYFGVSVGTAGDVNGDGYSDVIVGADGYTNGQTEEGRAVVYHGSADGLGPSPAWAMEGDHVSAWFGSAVSTAGDVNGDGYSDVIVGADGYTNGQTEEGRAYVYHGSPAGLTLNAAWAAEGNQAGAYFGVSVGTAGDVNGDGYSDVIVGADGYTNGQTEEGRAFVYDGSSLGLVPNPVWTAESDQASAGFGCSVGTAGDVNDDGYSDVIVGADGYTNGQTEEGRAVVYHGSPDDPVGIANGRAAPDALSLFTGVAPNPFAALTQLTYKLPGRGSVRLVVYDATGREVAVLREGEEDAGRHTVDWDGTSANGSRLPSGVYFVQLRFRDKKETRKIALTR